MTAVSAPAAPSARSVRPWLTPLLLVAMAGTAGTNAGSGPVDRPAMGLALLLAGVAAVAVLLPARPPAVPLLLAGGAVGVYLALGLAPGPVYLPVPLVVLVVALEAPTRRWLPGAVVAVVLVAAGSVVGLARGTVEVAAAAWPLTVLVTLVAAAGALASLARVRAEERAQRTERAAAEERLRMAQDLHDGVGHGLAVVAMQAGVALHVLDRDPAAARAGLEAIRETSRTSLELLRTELARLSAGPGAAGAPAAREPEPGLADLAGLLDRVRGGGLLVDLEVDGAATPASLPASPATGAVAHRVAQEALTNVLRHARARRARVLLAVDGDVLVVSVADDGVGAGGAPPGLGLTGMRDRLERAGGTLRAADTPGGGFLVEARLPLDGGTP